MSPLQRLNSPTISTTHSEIVARLDARLLVATIVLLACGGTPCGFARADSSEQIRRQIAELSPSVVAGELGEAFQDQVWRNLRARGDVMNRRDAANWRSLETRQHWEAMREEQLKRLRRALGGFPEPPPAVEVRVTNKIEGEGFVVENLVYRTRPGFWVTANLYTPSKTLAAMPGILIAHSHHRPKTQGELQDMGMTWARAGCLVLVIDQVGHGERADHPFQSEADYKAADADYRWWRQDYYYRFDTNLQLHLVGESLMGWMVWDLMRGVDVLLARPGIDPQKIVILGAVAGGGDVAAVTAALDRRIAAAVPFNFGGPQPETRYPLPADAEASFNYLGSAYWEGTRNLRRTGSDGFFHWVIVAGIAPRGLVYAHEFAWDQDRDPVWNRLNTIYGFYGANDRIDYTFGRGAVTGRPPDSTHCTNIGRHHRRRIHDAFQRWFEIRVTPADEYSQPLESDDLRSMTEAARRDLQPRKLFDVLGNIGDARLATARDRLAGSTASDRRRQLRAELRHLLGDIVPREKPKPVSQTSDMIADKSIVVERIALRTEADIIVPLMLLYPKQRQMKPPPPPMVVAVSQSGQKGFLRERSTEIAELLTAGAVVCLPDVRGAGTSRGSRGELGSASYYALLFDTPLLGYRLRDLRATLDYLRTREDLGGDAFALWGDSFAIANPRNTDFQVPWRVSGRPSMCEPLGGLLALLAALYEDDVTSVYVHGGLSSCRDVLSTWCVYIPHDVVVPGLLTCCDLNDLVAALAPRPVRPLEGLVDGLNRGETLPALQTSYAAAVDTYQATNPQAFSFATTRSSPASWLAPRQQKP